MNTDTELLDTLVPLCGASFGDVVAAGIDVPLRYAEFFVQLADGRTARLRNPRQLVGYDVKGAECRFCFRAGNELLCLDLARPRSANAFALERWTALAVCSAPHPQDPAVLRLGACMKLTATDGSLLFVALPDAEATVEIRTSRARLGAAARRRRAIEPAQPWLGR